MKAISLSMIIALVMVSGTVACGGNPNRPEPVCTEPGASNLGQPLPCVFPPAPTGAFAELQGTDPVSGATRTALNILPDGTKVGDPPVKAFIRFGLSKAQTDEIALHQETGLLTACLSVDGVNPVNGGCALHWLEDGKVTDTKTFALVVARFYTDVTETHHIIFTVGRHKRVDLSKPPTVVQGGTYVLSARFTWK